MSSKLVTIHYSPEKYQNHLVTSPGISSRVDLGQSSSQEGSTSISNVYTRKIPGVTLLEEPESGEETGASLMLKRLQSRSSVNLWVTDGEEIAASQNSSRNHIKDNFVPHNGQAITPGASRSHLIYTPSGYDLVSSSGSPKAPTEPVDENHKQSENGASDNPKDAYRPYKSTQDSLRDMLDFKNRSTTTHSLESLEAEWWYDVRNVSDRLHFLKESYKAIQLLKLKRLYRKTDNKELSVSLASTPIPHGSSFAISGLEEEPMPSSQNFQHISTQEDPYSSSNSNTDTPTPSAPIYLYK